MCELESQGGLAGAGHTPDHDGAASAAHFAQEVKFPHAPREESGTPWQFGRHGKIARSPRPAGSSQNRNPGARDRGGVCRPLVAENAGVEPGECRARVNAKLVGEPPTQTLIYVDRLGVPAGQVEGT